MDAVKAAVAEDDDDVPAARAFGDVVDDGVGVGQVVRFLAEHFQIFHELHGIEAVAGGELFQAGDLGEDHDTGIGKGVGQFVLEDVAPGGVGAGLEDGPDFFRGIFDAQGLEGLADGGGVMAEIVHNGDAAGDALDFHATFDAFEGVEGGLDLLVFQAAMLGAGDDGKGVADVEFADQVQMELEAGDFKSGGGGPELEVEGLHGVLRAQAEAFDRAMGDVEQRGEVGIVAVAEQEAVARDEADEMGERFLDGGEVLEDVGVVELEIVDDGDLGVVMDELAAFVKKRGVVFIALDNEPFAVGEAGALAEVVGDAADEVAGIEAVVLEDPGEQGGGGGFAVGAADDERAFAANEELAQQLGEGAITQLVVEGKLGFGVAAGDGVADDDEVGFIGEVLLGVTVDDFDFFGGQEGGHWFVNTLVGASYGKAFVLHGGGGGSHGCAADADKMDGFDVCRKHFNEINQQRGGAQIELLNLLKSTSVCQNNYQMKTLIEKIHSLGHCVVLGGLLLAGLVRPLRAAEPPSWVDPDTGHRVVQLSTEPGSESLYFNLNPFTPDGRKMVITTPEGISLVDLASGALETVVKGNVHIIMVGHKTGQIYYTGANRNDRAVMAVDPVTKAVRVIARLARGQSVASVNADETLLAGTITERVSGMTNGFNGEGGPNTVTDTRTADEQRRTKPQRMEERLAEHLPMELFFLNIATGEVRTYDRCTDWLNHLQFSPTDPTLLLFCHEGPWHKVDRIWTIRTDGTQLTKIHQRTMAMEIAGHEFFSADGKTIWYDLQTPRGEDFWVAGYEIATGKRTWYHLQRDEWSVHFNVAPGGQYFSGDGGDEGMVAHADHGKWLYLFHPELLPDSSGPGVASQHLIHIGVFHAEKLVNLAKHDYALEPNAMFSPDMKWLIFRSNLSGASQVYAVELTKPGPPVVWPASKAARDPE